MSEEVELKPLTPGAVKVSSGKEKLDFPVAKMIQVHIVDGKYGDFDKEITEDDGSKRVIKQTKVSFKFEVDSEVTDVSTKESLKGKTFTKSITLSSHERATYPGFITAVTGAYTDDPSAAVGKPLQVMFGNWSEFGGTPYQPVTYLPPAEDQSAPAKDVVISAEEFDAAVTSDDLFGPEVN